MDPYNIAIIGAGPAGCTLARLLDVKTHAKVTLFEAEKEFDFRAQGGTLDLHKDGGLTALKEANLWDDFLKHARFDGEALLIADKKLKAWIHIEAKRDPSDKNSRLARPEIDRRLLRKILYDALPQDTVQWNRKVERVEANAKSTNGRKTQTLHFTDGTSAGGFDLIVGADGAWSKARKLLSDVTPHYSGMHRLTMVIPDAEKQYPELYKIVNRGSIFCFSDGKNISAQYLSDGSLYCGSSGVRSADWLKEEGLSTDNPGPLKESLRKKHADWAPELRGVIDRCDDRFTVPYPFYMLPVDFRWDHRSGVTAIGDAAHLMTPYAGAGVNVAMHDALDLARAIMAAEKQGSIEALDRNVANFEEDMFVRAHESMEATWANCQDMLLTPGAPGAKIQEYAGRVLALQMPRPVRPLVRIGMRVYFWWKKLFMWLRGQ